MLCLQCLAHRHDLPKPDSLPKCSAFSDVLAVNRLLQLKEVRDAALDKQTNHLLRSCRSKEDAVDNNRCAIIVT
jgi:hypothetical protein